MNRLKGKITEISSYKGISLVNIQIGNSSFRTVLLDTPSSCSYLKLDKNITVAFKETEVAIGLLNVGSISMSNQIKCIVKSIQKGKILTQIGLTCKDGDITSIITSRSSSKLKLEKGKEVIALIKANEISLIEEK